MTYQQPYPPPQPYGVPQPKLRSVVSTVIVTFLFSPLFGLIPAVKNTSHAADLGMTTSKYWKAYGITAVAWLAVVIISAASGGSNGNSSSPYRPVVVPQVQQTDFPTAIVGSDNDAAFNEALSVLGINVSYPQDEAQVACNDLGNGDDLIGTVTQVSTDTGIDVFSAGEFVGAAVAAYCPQYTDLVGQ